MPSPRIFAENSSAQQWLNGPANPGSGLGSLGNYYLNTTSKEVFLKISPSVWASQGKLTSGGSGGSGNAFLSGNSDPSAAANDTDKWLNKFSGSLWEQLGNWRKIGYIATIQNSNMVIGLDNITNPYEGGTESLLVGAETHMKMGSESIGIGYQLGGYTLLNQQLGSRNTVIGHKSLLSSSSTMSTAGNLVLGSYAGNQIGSASGNIALGHYAMGSDPDVLPGFCLSTGSSNIALGSYSLASIKGSADTNVAVGNYAGYSLTTGASNTFIGQSSGYAVTSARNNIFLGFFSGAGTSTGSSNVAIGPQTLYSSPDTSYCVILGQGAGKSCGNYSNIIGYNAAPDIGSSSQSSNVMGAEALGSYGTGSTVGTSNVFLSRDSSYGQGIKTLQNSNILSVEMPAIASISSSNLMGYNLFKNSATTLSGPISNSNVIGYNLLTRYSAANSFSNNTVIGSSSINAISTAATGLNALGYNNANNATSFTSVNIFGNACATSATSISNSEIIGSSAGGLATSITDSVFLGSSTQHSSSAASNVICIGKNASSNASNQIVLGNSSHTSLRIPRFTSSGTLSTDASGNITSSSDERMKTDIKTITGALEILSRTRGITHKWRSETGLDTIMRYGGCIAQDWAKEFPDCVAMETNTGMYSLNYNIVTATLVEAVKELYTRLKALEAA